LVVGDEVFVVAQQGSAATAYELSLVSGAVAWQLPLEDAPNANIAYGDGVLVLSHSDGVVGIDAQTGTQRWALPGSDDDPNVPTVAGGAAYVDGPSGLEKVELSDGSVDWSSSVHGEAVISGNRVFVQDNHDAIAVLDTGSGAVLSQRASGVTSGRGGGSGAVYGGLVYDVQSDTNMALDAADLSQVGSFTSSPYPVFDGADMYSIAQSQLAPGARLRAEDLGTGTVRWSDRLPAMTLYEPPLADNGYLYLANGAGLLSVYRESDGAQVWTADLGSPLSGTATHLGMAAGDGHLVVATADGLVAYAGTGLSGCGAGGACAALPVDASVHDSEAPDQSSSAAVDPAHDSDEPDQQLSAPLSERWGVSFDGTPSFVLNAEGMTYTVVTHPDLKPGWDLEALDDNTGQPTWGPVDVGSDIFPGDEDLAYGAGRLFVLPVPGVVQARSADTGALLWTREVPGARSVLFYDGKVIAAQSALDPADGSTEWSAGASGPNRRAGRVTLDVTVVSAAAGGGAVFYGSTTGVEAINAADGSPLWNKDLFPDAVKQLSYSAGHLIASDNTFLDVLDAQTGSSALSGRLSHFSAAYDGPSRYVVQQGVLVKLPLTGTTPQWTFSGDHLFSYEPPLLVGQDIWVASEGGGLYEVDANSGALEWRGSDGCSATGDLRADLLVADDQLLISCPDRLISLSATASTSQTAPSAPTNVQTFGADSSAYLSWTPPAYPVTGVDEYRITAEPGSVQQVVTSSSGGGTITGLTNGTAYTFTVQAHDAAGWGPASAPTLYGLTPRAGAWQLRPFPALIGAELDPVAVNKYGHVAVNAGYRVNNVDHAAITENGATNTVSPLPPGPVTAMSANDNLAGTAAGAGWSYTEHGLSLYPGVSQISGIDDRGRLAATRLNRALIDDHGTITHLTAKTVESVAHGMSATGVVFGAAEVQPTEWTPQPRPLSDAGFRDAAVTAASSDGTYFAGIAENQVGFRSPLIWHGSTRLHLIGAYGCPVNQAAVNDQGIMVGASCPSSGGSVATVWSTRTGTDANTLVDAPNTHLDAGVGISDDDQIIVVGSTFGVTQPYFLTPPANWDQQPTLTLTRAPTISGTPHVGRTLAVTTGTWSAYPGDLGYVWRRNGQPIPGATDQKYTPVLADAGTRLTVTVTAARYGYHDGTATTAPVAVAHPFLRLKAPPHINGKPRPGHKLTATPGRWAPIPSRLHYQWLRNGHLITGATRVTYLLKQADQHHRLAVRVTATRPIYRPTTARSGAVYVR
jgi:outer membrane protein assembly factor BamB